MVATKSNLEAHAAALVTSSETVKAVSEFILGDSTVAGEYDIVQVVIPTYVSVDSSVKEKTGLNHH